MSTSLTVAPVFCPNCRQPKTFKRQPERDIKSESGKTLWERWICPDCDYKTIEPIIGNL
jgi:RNase P subunit RPR2